MPLSITTNENVNIQDFIKTDTQNQYVKQYTTSQKTIPLSSIINMGFKHNSFICCRIFHANQQPIPSLKGEIRIRDLLNRRVLNIP
jgi:hypothetical protein